MKWIVGQVTIRNAYVHDNDCKGLWADINAHDTLIEHNLVENNRPRESSMRSVTRQSSVTIASIATGRSLRLVLGWRYHGGL
jgi:hypothetical protein